MKIEKLKKYYIRHGFLKTLLRILEKVGIIFRFNRLCLWEKNLLEHSNNIADENMHFESIDKCKLDKIENYYDGWFYKDKAIERLDEVHKLFMMSNENNICCYVWIDFEEAEVNALDLRFLLPPDTACLAYIYTTPEQRNKGMGTLAENKVINMLKAERYKKLIAFVDPKNIGSTKMHQNLGFKMLRLYTYIRVFSLKVYICKDYLTNIKQYHWDFGIYNRKLSLVYKNI